jgi:hypothetical protein
MPFLNSNVNLGSTTVDSGVNFVYIFGGVFEFDFDINTLTISFEGDAVAPRSVEFSEFDFNGYRFVFTNSDFAGLASIDFREKTAGVTGTPSATLDGPNGFFVELGGVEFSNVNLPQNNLSEPASVTFEVTFAGHDAAVVPLPPSFAMALTVLGGFGLWARRKRAAA